MFCFQCVQVCDRFQTETAWRNVCLQSLLTGNYSFRASATPLMYSTVFDATRKVGMCPLHDCPFQFKGDTRRTDSNWPENVKFFANVLFAGLAWWFYIYATEVLYCSRFKLPVQGGAILVCCWPVTYREEKMVGLIDICAACACLVLDEHKHVFVCLSVWRYQHWLPAVAALTAVF